MTKNAKIAIIVSIIALIALIVVLSSTVFSVQKAEVVWYKEPSSTLSAIDDETVLAKSNVKSQSVFFLDRNKAITSLEDSFPELRVIDIEVAWPNVMKIHAIEREAVYVLPVKDGKFAVVDEYFKVLDVINSFDSTKTNAVLLTDETVKQLSVSKGYNINIFGKGVFRDTYYAFIELSRDITDFRAIAKSVSVSETTLIITTHQGTTIKIDKPFANTRVKVRMAINTFDKLTTEDYPNSVIYVFVNDDNQLVSRYYTE